MTLTTAQQVRLKIQDLPLRADDTYYFDGSALAFALPHNNVVNGTAYVADANGQWSATGATFNATGFVTFGDIGSANSAFRTVYDYSTFSDADIGNFTAIGGSVVGAAIEACHALMFDSLRRARWMAPDGSQHDDSMAQTQVMRIYSALKKEEEEDAITQAGFNSWSLEQQNY